MHGIKSRHYGKSNEYIRSKQSFRHFRIVNPRSTQLLFWNNVSNKTKWFLITIHLMVVIEMNELNQNSFIDFIMHHFSLMSMAHFVEWRNNNQPTYMRKYFQHVLLLSLCLPIHSYSSTFYRIFCCKHQVSNIVPIIRAGVFNKCHACMRYPLYVYLNVICWHS